MPAQNRVQSLLVVLIAAVALLGAYLVGTNSTDPASAADETVRDPGVRGFVAPGTGTVTAVPDQLSFSVTVEHQAGDSVEAMERTSAGATKLRRALTSAGVARKDISTTSVQIEPTYRYEKGRSIPTGFRSSQGLRVLVRDLPRAGAVLSKAAVAIDDKGRIGGVAMEIGDRTALQQKARAAAMKASREAAEAYAESAGKEVGDVVYVDEVPASTPRPNYGDFALNRLSMDAVAAIPIEAGEQDVVIQLKVRWAIG